MPFRTPLFGILFALLMGLAAQPAVAQQGPHPHYYAVHGAQKQAAKANKPPQSAKPNGNASAHVTPEAGTNKAAGANGKGDGRALAGMPPKWVSNLREMSPQEQERFMQNNQRFQNLPPGRQAQVRQNLQKWNQLSPTERNAMRDRERVWEQMTPEQRQHFQNDIQPKLQQMPPHRRQLINGRLHTLQGMTPAERNAALDDPRFMQGLSPDEQSTLRDLNSLTSPHTP